MDQSQAWLVRLTFPVDIQAVGKVNHENVGHSARAPGVTSDTGLRIHIWPVVLKRPIRLTVKPAILLKRGICATIRSDISVGRHFRVVSPVLATKRCIPTVESAPDVVDTLGLSN